MRQGLYIKTYGCQMNVYDSVMMQNMMQAVGFRLVDDLRDASVIILNTCHIREKATEKLYSELGRINSLCAGRDVTVVVAGCLAQAEGDEVFKRAPYVSVVVGPQSVHTLPELIGKVQRKRGHVINVDFPEDSKFDIIGQENCIQGQGVASFLSIQEGCDKFCTFCVVPYTRGAEYSRPVHEVVANAEGLVKNGSCEITLLGQNVNAYHGTYIDEVYDLGKLIKRLAQIDGLKRIRYTTSHPRDMHDSLYEVHASEPKLMPYLHLPVQSGSDRVLTRMNRKYTVADYLHIIEKIRTVAPDIAISSDFIVGFPGETDDDFQLTLDLAEKVSFAQSFSFMYSPRLGTPGAAMENQIDQEVKSQRLSILQKVLFADQLKFNKSMEGKVLSVLFTGKSDKHGSQWVGRSQYMQPVYVDLVDNFDFLGKILRIEVIAGYQNSLYGKLAQPVLQCSC